MNLERLLVKYRTFSAIFRHAIVATVKLVEHSRDKGGFTEWGP